MLLAQQARFNCVEAASVLSETSANNRAARWRGENRSGQGDGGSSGKDCCAYLKSAQAARAAVAVDRASGDHPLFVGSSGDITRSSVLRASTTLDTIAPLDETGRSLSFDSRAGSSFPGELFLDSNFPPRSSVEAAQRYGLPQLQREHPYRRSDGTPLGPSLMQQQLMQQLQRPQQRRARSAPTLPSEMSADSRFEPAQSAVIARAPSADSGAAVPPAVVGAWLAAAIEGIYFRNASTGQADPRNGQAELLAAGSSSQARGARASSLDLGAMLDADHLSQGRGPLGGVSDLRSMRTTSVSVVGGAPPGGGVGSNVDHDGHGRDQHGHGRIAGVLSFPPVRGESPPPPPPPPETQLEAADDNAGGGGGIDDGLGSSGDLANDEEMFYQRQRLLQRVVTAAASHGGVAPLTGCGGSVGVGGSTATSPENEQDVGELSVRDGAWRRHSDPMSSWETASVPAAALSRGGLGGGAGGWAGRGSPAYLRRQTAGYWRDKLGMTQ